MKLSQLKQQIEELDAKATKGPWVVLGDLSGIWQDDVDEGICSFDSSDINIKHNSDFIALSRTALPELLRRLLVAEAALENLAQVVDIELRFEGHRTQLANELELSKEALATIRGEEE